MCEPVCESVCESVCAVLLKLALFCCIPCLPCSVAANSAVYMSMTAFTFILSVPVLRERVTVLKVAAVAIQIGGVFMVAYAKNHCPPAPHWSSFGNASNTTQNVTATLSDSSGDSTNPCDNNDTVLGYVVGTPMHSTPACVQF